MTCQLFVSGCCSVVLCSILDNKPNSPTMQSSTLFILACLVAAVTARTFEESPAVDAVSLMDDAAEYEAVYDAPAHDRSPRNKRGLLLLKKKLLLGALGLKAAKVGVVGAGVAGALALKKKPSVHYHHEPVVSHAYTDFGYSSHGPSWNVDVHSWH